MIFLKLHGHVMRTNLPADVMRTNLPVELVIQGAFHKQEHATNWMIVLMGVMRLQHSVVSVISTEYSP